MAPITTDLTSLDSNGGSPETEGLFQGFEDDDDTASEMGQDSEND